MKQKRKGAGREYNNKKIGLKEIKETTQKIKIKLSPICRKSKEKRRGEETLKQNTAPVQITNKCLLKAIAMIEHKVLH